jgi:hypothetical protein
VKEKFNVSFRKHPKETGLGSVAYPYQDSDIKVNKKKCGYIVAPNHSNRTLWKAQICVKKKDINEDGNPNCPWRWMYIIKKFKEESEARLYIKKNLKRIIEKYNLTLHFSEE